MITLYTFGPAFGLPDASPFVIKAEMLLKLAKLPYTKKRADVRKAPKGKLPYIEDDGEIVADSTFIRWHLERKYGIDFETGLSEAEKATAWALEKLLEDNLYWANVDARWLNDANFERGPAQLFKKIPQPLRFLIQKLVRRKVRNSLQAQGMGRHTHSERMAIAQKGIHSVATILGEKPYAMGDTATAADAVLFAFITSGACPLFDTPIRDYIESCPNLMAYIERMRQEFFEEKMAT